MIATVPTRCEIVGRRLVGVALLQQQQHHAIARQRAVDGLDRDRPADAERRDGHRQHDRAAQRNDGKFGGEGGSRFSHKTSKRSYCRLVATAVLVSCSVLADSASVDDWLPSHEPPMWTRQRQSRIDSTERNHPPPHRAAGTLVVRAEHLNEAAFLPRDRDREVERADEPRSRHACRSSSGAPKTNSAQAK